MHISTKRSKGRRQEILLWVCYALTFAGFAAGIIIGALGLGLVPGPAKQIVWFTIGAFVSFSLSGGAFLLSIHFLLVNVDEQLERLDIDVQCSYVGNEEAAVCYVADQYQKQSLQTIRDTHVRSEGDKTYDSKTYRSMKRGLDIFLKRSPNNQVVLIAGQIVDNEYVQHIIDAAEKRENRVKCHRLHSKGPLLNFVILDYDNEESEVFFGWGRHLGKAEAIFRSGDPRLVREFSTFYDILCQPDMSQRVPLSSLLAPPEKRAEAVTVSDTMWEEKEQKFYDFLRSVKRGNEGKEYEEERDIRILTGSILDFEKTMSALQEPFRRRVRVKLLMMNPDNEKLMDARYGVRNDSRTAKKVRSQLREQIVTLTEVSDLVPTDKTLLEVKISNIMPCGFVAQAKTKALMAFMPAHYSYLHSPMLEVPTGTVLWEMLNADWKARWAKADSPSEDQLSQWKLAP